MDDAKQEPVRLSHLDAARQMTFIARSASSWAIELLTLPEVAHLPWPSANAERFAVEIETKIGCLVERTPRRREGDLLEANNRYLQRARDAEQEVLELREAIARFCEARAGQSETADDIRVQGNGRGLSEAAIVARTLPVVTDVAGAP